MGSKANFWKFVTALVVISGLAISGAYLLISRHLEKARFDRAARITGGNPRTGAQLIERFGCGTCHIIPGIKHAEVTVAPDLTQIRRRPELAGALKNNPENMQRWILNPRSIDPQTSMPVLGVSSAEARDIVAYLYTLE